MTSLHVAVAILVAAAGGGWAVVQLIDFLWPVRTRGGPSPEEHTYDD